MCAYALTLRGGIGEGLSSDDAKGSGPGGGAENDTADVGAVEPAVRGEMCI